MPDVKGRHDILKLHLKNVQVSEGESFNLFLNVIKFWQYSKYLQLIY